MDFDDLEAETEQRIEAGEAVAGYVRQNRQPPKGAVLERLPRNKRVPRDIMLPDKARNLLPPSNALEKLKPKLRLLIFYGAGDNVCSTWAQMQYDVFPECGSYEIEVATYEWPGHGTREHEQLLKTVEGMRDDAFEGVKEAMDTGTFAVCGHSIGCLVATAVCEKARRELAVEPVYAIMLERGAPQFPVLNANGLDMLRNRIEEFLPYYGVPFVSKIGGEHGKAMWQHDMELENDNFENRGPDFYRYSCPILVVCALGNYNMAVYEDQLDEGSKAFKKAREEKISYFGTCYNFSKEMYEEWKHYTTHEAGAHVLYIDSDHYGVKTHKEVRRMMWKVLRETIESFGGSD